MGVNAIQTYTMWHLHEPFRPGSYDFSGPLDLEAFLDAAAAEGLWVLLRPGPYVCAEVDAGGLPWWLHDPSAGSGAGPQLRPRTADPAFLGFVDSWWGTLLPMMRPRMAVNGGNVLMVQMENEYGSFNSTSFFSFFFLLESERGRERTKPRKIKKKTLLKKKQPPAAPTRKGSTSATSSRRRAPTWATTCSSTPPTPLAWRSTVRSLGRRS